MLDLQKLKKYLEEYFNIDSVTKVIGEKNHFVIISSNFMIYVDEINHKLDVSINVSTRPHEVANFILLLTRYEEKTNIEITESFILNEKYQLITGEEAEDFYLTKMSELGVREYSKEKMYEEILSKVKCFDC